ELIPEKAMGPRNDINDLQNYVVGAGRNGLVVQADGTLDLEHSFARLNYFEVIHEQKSVTTCRPRFRIVPWISWPRAFRANRSLRRWTPPTYGRMTTWSGCMEGAI